MKIEIIPAVIAESQEELAERINWVRGGAGIIQLDVMDGVFVPNKSINFDFKLPRIGCGFETHLMVKNPDKWVEDNWKKADTFLIHIESCKNPRELINFLKTRKKRVGFALNPETSLERIRDYLNDIDQVLIMTVQPGFYGSKFLPETLGKVKTLRRLKPKMDIEVDGGVNPETIKIAFDAGANYFVSGSYIMNSPNPKEAIKNLQKLCRR